MIETILNFRCRKCTGTVIKWTRLSPNAHHKHRVTCNQCDCFVSWGNASQFQALLASGQHFVHVTAEVESTGATLKDWF
jgi:hypothetical protein